MTTILLVEDEPLMRRVLRESLALNGYRVLDAGNGQEALEALSQWQGPIDVLVTDIVMPRMGGVELMRQVRQRQPGLPVVIISGWPVSNRDAIDDRTLFLKKPVTYGQLAKALHRSLVASTQSD